jgi:hypothetical protein
MIILIFLIGGLFSSSNDSTGLKFLKQYDPKYVSYQHLSVGLDGSGRLRSNLYNSVSGYGNKDYYFFIYPSQSLNLYRGNFSLTSRGNLQGAFQWYPFPVPLFAMVDGNLHGDYSEMSENDIIKDGVAEVEVGLGFGRIIPLSDAYKTLKIEEELINLRELIGRFDRRELEKISDQIVKKEKYLDERDFWRDLDSIITETESFKHDRLNAVSAIRIDKILNSSLRSRVSRLPYISAVDIDNGYETGFYFGYHYRYSRYIDESSDEINRTKEIYTGVKYDFAHPLSVKLHLYGHSSGEAYLSDSVGLKEVNLSFGLNYEVFNSFFSDLSIGYTNSKNRHLTWGRDEEYLGLDWRNIYYIDYKLAISLNGYLFYYTRIGDHSDFFSGALTTSIDYYFF